MTNERSTIAPLLAPLEALQRLLDRFPGKGLIIGGIAASLLGIPRLTADLDALIMISTKELPSFFEAARMEGLKERIPNALEFARKHRVVLLRHTESRINIDISLGLLPFEREMVARSNSHQVGGITINLPTPEDLIILKAVAHRQKDLQDIQGIVQNHPQLDREHIKKWVMQFAQLLERPELWTDISDLF